MKRSRRILSLVLALIMICSTMGIMSFAFDGKVDKVLFITDDAGLQDVTDYTATYGEDPYAEYDSFESSELDSSLLARYRAIAFPFVPELEEEISLAAENGCIVYLYGDVTIEQYKNATGLGEYSTEVAIRDENGVVYDTVTHFFDDEYERSESFNVICHGTDPLLAYVDGDSEGNKTARCYFVPIRNHFSRMTRLGVQSRGAVIVKSHFGYVTYFGPNSETTASMDYELYRETAETVSSLDYFCIKTRVWVDTEFGDISALRTQLTKAFENDNLREAKPETRTECGTISGTIGFGDGLQAGISFSMDLSSVEPDIERTLSLTNDTVLWEMTPHWVGNQSLKGLVLETYATWATPATGEAGININFGGEIKILGTRYESNFRAIHPRYRY